MNAIPPPAPLPPGSYMPLSCNPLFVGRAQDLRRLVRALSAGGSAAIGQIRITAATGIGGIGKTQLACEFVHCYGQFFPGGVFWLSFADPAVVPVEVAACGGSAGMQLSPEFDTLPLKEQVNLVLAIWESPRPRLLVFDNCEDEALLQQWRPKYGGCYVLVTSRRHHWDVALGVQPVALDVLPRVDSLTLLRTFRPDLAHVDADLHAIAAALGDLPLALHLAGSFLAKYRYGITPAQYRARLHAPTILDDRSLHAVGLSPTLHVQHVARTFEQSYERLDGADPADALALALLARAACFVPGEPLPRWLLVDTLQLPEADAEGVLLAEDALTRLIDLGLLETDTIGNLRLHRLLVAFVQAMQRSTAAQAVVEATILRVADTLNEHRNPRSLLVIQPQLRFIMEVAQPRTDAGTAALCNALGYQLWLLGVYDESQHYHEQALAIRQRVLGGDHPDTAVSLNNLGIARWAQGQYAAAQEAYQHALAIRQRVLGGDHPDIARSLNNLGVVLKDQGQYAAAHDYIAQALAIYQRAPGSNQPLIALSLNNLGNVLWAQGQYAAAQGYYKQALAIREGMLGADHPDTVDSRNNLGNVLWAQGQYAAAQEAYQQVVAIYQRVLGPDHPDTADSLNNLGGVLKDQGQYAAAQGYVAQALAIRQRVLGSEHPDTAVSLTTLGVILADQGQYAQAHAYVAQALAIQARMLGSAHPETAKSLDSLGMVLQAQGRYAAAQGYAEQAVTIQQRVLGADHPDTARSLRRLGEILYAQGETGAARCYLDRALTILLERLGPHHPDTEQTRQLLATLAADPPSAERGAGG
ncbi:MAG TPA: tetratricopeptide repeat protein [Herpetosiphonaceae bacterium]